VTKWFEGNPLALVLASICGGLVLISLILAIVWSMPPSAGGDSPDAVEADLVVDVPELRENEPIETYAVITERPVFNQSRMPILDDDPSDTDEEELAEVEVDAPEFELAGVIITPSIRMVTLRTKDQQESLVAFEGQPLQGNYGTWQVSVIEPRQITLASGRGEEVQLKLQVHDVAIAAPPKPVPAASDTAQEPGSQAVDGENDQPLTRAEEIRQRIAQRREELRQAAEEEGEEEFDPREYRRQLQSKLTGVQKKEEPDEN
jgi:hypothetical protein